MAAYFHFDSGMVVIDSLQVVQRRQSHTTSSSEYQARFDTTYWPIIFGPFFLAIFGVSMC